LTAEQKQTRVQMVIELLQVLSVQSTRQWDYIVALVELWIYVFSEQDLMWTAPGKIVVDKERHKVQSPKFMLTVVWNPIGFHVPCSESHPEGTQIQCTILYYYIIIQMISWSKSQIGGCRPGEHGRTSCGYILIMLGHTPRNTAKMSRDYIGLNQMKQAPHPPIPQIWHPRPFPFWLRQRKSDGISR
jgi:hypothetical protein